MKIILLSLFFIVTSMILATKDNLRMIWLFIGIFILNDTINIGPINVYTIYIMAFIISLYIHDELKQEWNKFPFKIILYILFLLHVCIAVFDERINNDIAKIISRIFNNFTPRYMALFVGYALLNNLNRWKKLVTPLFMIFFIMSIYGLITWFIQDNPYYEMMNEIFREKEGIWTKIQSRGYRVFSTLTNPIVYSFVMCIFGHLIFLWRKHISPTLWFGLFSLVVLNIFFAYSRTGIVAGILLVFMFLLSKYKLSWRMYLSLATCVLTITVAYFTIPLIHHVTDSIIDIFTTGGENTKGSTIALKFKQLQASLYFFSQAPFFGNGFSFFHENISRNLSDIKKLAGMEGYGYRLLIEEGLFMIIAVCFFFYAIYTYFFQRRYLGDYAHAGIAWISSSLAFLLLAGDYGGIFTISMLLTGFLLKVVQLNEVLYLNILLKRSKILKIKTTKMPLYTI